MAVIAVDRLAAAYGDKYGAPSFSPNDGAPVTPSDTDELVNVCLGVYVGGAGDVTVVTQLATTLVFKAVPVGTTVWLRCRQIKSTGTTATYIVALGG